MQALRELMEASKPSIKIQTNARAILSGYLLIFNQMIV
jgi:hypothetical protein